MKAWLQNLRDGGLRGFLRTSGKTLLIVGFGVVVFVVALLLTFPYDRAADFIEATARKQGYDLEIGELGPIFGVGVEIDNVELTTIPRHVDEKPLMVKVDTARINTSLLAAALGEQVVHVVAGAFGGEVDVDIEASKSRGAAVVSMREVRVARLPGVREKLGLPIQGTLDLDVDLAADGMQLDQANGTVLLSCEGCVVGNNKAKFSVPGNPMLESGIVVPRIELGALRGKVVFDRGVGVLQGVRSRSPDMQLEVEGQIRLGEPLNRSTVDLYVRFSLSEALVASQDTIGLALQFAAEGKQDDGFYGVHLTGPVSRLRPPKWAKERPALPPARPARAPRPGERR